MISFDMTTEQVFPVRSAHGAESLGIADTLVRAHEIQLAIAQPQAFAATIRFLLAVTIDAFGLPTRREWEQRWDAGRYDEDAVAGFLSRYRDRFDLFGAAPAWQVADLSTAKGETKPSSLLIPAMPTGNNVPLFASRTEAEPPELTAAQAARAILTLQAFDTAAIKTGTVGDETVRGGKTTGNPTGPLGQLGLIVPTGPSLYETLLLNTPLSGSVTETGEPWWHRPPETSRWATRRPVGLLDLLTWQSRRIRLFPEQRDDGSVAIRQVLVSAGDRIAGLSPDLEIHTAWRDVTNRKPDDPALRPVRHQSGRQLWRGLAGLVAAHQASSADGMHTSILLEQLGELVDVISPAYPLGIRAVGVTYGNQSAVVEDVYSDVIPLPIRALGAGSDEADLVTEMAAQAEEARRAVNELADNVRRAAGGDPVPWDKGDHPGNRMMAELDLPVRDVLERLQRSGADLDEIRDGWEHTLRAVAERIAEVVIAAAPAAGFLGRNRDTGAANSKNKSPITVPLAEIYFRARLHKAVPHAFEERISA